MKQYNIAGAKSRFSELVKLALQGEEVLIARDNKPILKLTPLHAPLKKRMPGTAKGQVLSVAPDFDALPEDSRNMSDAPASSGQLSSGGRMTRRNLVLQPVRF